MGHESTNSSLPSKKGNRYASGGRAMQAAPSPLPRLLLLLALTFVVAKTTAQVRNSLDSEQWGDLSVLHPTPPTQM